MNITLDELLASRDARHQQQMLCLQHFPHATLVCLTVVMPGSEKRNEQSLTVAAAAVEELRKAFSSSTLMLEERDLPTGYEAYLVTTQQAEAAKRKCCKIEDSHPLGRLFDIDVILPDGSPLSRAAVGSEPRLCLICDNEARYCMRNRTHTQQQLQQRINEMIASYRNSSENTPHEMTAAHV